MGFDMSGGPLSGPSVPKPRLTWTKAFSWPRNQPGWKATAPPVVGQYVRFLVVGTPPPREMLASARERCDDREQWSGTYKGIAIACRRETSRW